MDPDSEDDSDYVPPTHDNGDSDHSDAERRAPKRPRTDAPSEAIDAANKQTSEEVYAEFKASLATPLSRPAQAHAPKEMVKVVKRYRYAGEEITEVKEVAADSEEAKKWPRWQPSDDAANAESSASAKTSGPSGVAPSSSTPTPATNTPAANPAGKRPGPRKAKSKLADIPSRKEPIKRLTTLDKSAMDWRAHVEGEASADVKDELEANRRGGGYLEKVEFLQRVEARKEEVLDANKGKRRR